jgi:molybdopterin-guanine dinucleotide biosynthesis protein A
MEMSELDSAAVLCGGRGRRMGSDKGLLLMDDRPFIEIITVKLLGHFSEVLVVLRDTQQARAYRGVLDDRVRILTDELPGTGPLGGIYTALGSISREAALFLPCDAPLVTDEFLLNMKECFRRLGGSCDALVPWGDDGPEPLHAVYSARVRGTVEELLSRNKRKVGTLIESINSCRIAAISLDPTLQSFRNFNRPEDLRI